MSRSASPSVPEKQHRLSDVPAGIRMQIRALDANGDGLRLRELGMLEGRVVRLLCNADPLICAVERGRVALRRRVADGILVEPLAEPTPSR